ncbi:hypothetical protein [Lysinibacillus sp. NPDC093688]|uniref:hypothetical protein n=1 Tax=Lysinibacillus sp. NPDC093688 TaxID=3390577 RepID=UPI003D0438E0
MKRYLITTKEITEFIEPEATTLADSKDQALVLLSTITNSDYRELVSVIEVDIVSVQAVELEPFLDEKFKLDLREKQ